MISINFAVKNYRVLERIQMGVVAFVIFLSAALAISIVHVVTLRAEAASLAGKMRDAEQAEARISPLLAERGRVVKELSAMTVLLESRRFSWTKLLSDIEAAFPTGVALDKLDYNPHTGMLTLDGMAQSPEALRSLMVGLERSPSFREPYLKHQSVDKGSISFNVVASYQTQDNASARRK